MNEEKYRISEKELMMRDFGYENHQPFVHKINMEFLQENLLFECYRDRLVSYYQLAPLVDKTVPIEEADYILYENAYARLDDLTSVVLADLEWIDKHRKENAEIIVMGKAVNIKGQLDGKYKNVTYVPSHYAEYLGKRFGLEIKDKYVVYDDKLDQLNIWPVDGCLNKCGFCRRTWMDIPFESISLDYIKEQLDYFKQYHPEQMKHISIRAENLTQYGLDIYGKQMLHEVIDLVNSYDEVEAFEFPIGLNIGEITPEILDSLCKCKKIWRIVINFEAGSNRMLKLINKKHTREQALDVCKMIRQYHPEVYIESTVIVGLPTEGLQDIIELADLIEQSDINYVHCNYYWHSEKNALDCYPQVSDKVKEYHLSYLIRLLKKNHSCNNQLLTMYHEKIEDTSKRSVYRELQKLAQEQKHWPLKLLRVQYENFIGENISIKTEAFDELKSWDDVRERAKKIILARKKSGCDRDKQIYFL